jgi:sugar phosphate isomerase/epimerase
VARLGLPLVQSYERRYTKGLDATFYFSLTRPLAKRLYRYLDKVRNGRGSFEIGVCALADVLGLEYRYPSDIKDGLAEAHAELQASGYLAAAGYAPRAGGYRPTAGGAGEKVTYSFHPAFDRRPRRRAGSRGQEARGITDAPAPSATDDAGTGSSSPLREALALEPRTTLEVATAGGQKPPLQLELESFGMTAARAAALIAARTEAEIAAQVEYVRRLMRSPNGRTLKNPAGYLARAIEQSYVTQAQRLDGGRAGTGSSAEAPLGCASQAPAEQTFAAVVDNLRAAYAAVAAEGAELLVEAQRGAAISSPQDTARLLDALPGLRLNHDPGQFACLGYEQASYEPLYPRTAHIHMRQARPGALQETLEAGSIDWRRVVRGLQAAGFHGVYAMEYVHFPGSPDCAGVDVVTETIKMRDLIRDELAAIEPATNPNP